MDYAYPLAPVVGYVVAGGLKFVVNSALDRRPALGRIGLGGAVSTHTTIVATTAWLIALREGVDTPMFAVALTLAAIVIIDALDLRRHIGGMASVLKLLHPGRGEVAALRHRLGHRPHEVAAGILVGFVCAFVLNWL
jgi:acid phosphatase family membrane protein YuiD